MRWLFILIFLVSIYALHACAEFSTIMLLCDAPQHVVMSLKGYFKIFFPPGGQDMTISSVRCEANLILLMRCMGIDVENDLFSAVSDK